MAELVPTIMEKTVDAYKARWAIYNQFANRVQVDLAEAGFAGDSSLSLEEIITAGGWPDGKIVDLHIMSAQPAKYVPLILQKRPNLAIFQVESGDDLTDDFAALKGAGIKVGVAFAKSTYPKDYENIIKSADHALIFNGNQSDMGLHTQPGSNLLLLEKASLIRAINPSIEISWDGGASLENVHQIAVAGVNVVCVGGALANAEDPKATYDALTAEMNRPEVV